VGPSDYAQWSIYLSRRDQVVNGNTPSINAQERCETKLFIYIQSEKLKKQVKRLKPGILKEKVIRKKRIRVNFVVAILSHPSDGYYLVQKTRNPSTACDRHQFVEVES